MCFILSLVLQLSNEALSCASRYIILSAWFLMFAVFLAMARPHLSSFTSCTASVSYTLLAVIGALTAAEHATATIGVDGFFETKVALGMVLVVLSLVRGGASIASALWRGDGGEQLPKIGSGFVVVDAPSEAADVKHCEENESADKEGITKFVEPLTVVDVSFSEAESTESAYDKKEIEIIGLDDYRDKKSEVQLPDLSQLAVNVGNGTFQTSVNFDPYADDVQELAIESEDMHY
eukprot:GILI01025413.1.p1 GENE.GILI01025413.1~~GILI01025413.1.p1  ORF type:complete len:235 (+),score=27.09 GILI01025413.1:317-1021(+)